MRKYTAVVEKDDDWWCAYCPELGTVSQGKTKKSALVNLKEVTELYLEEVSQPVQKSFISSIQVNTNVNIKSIWS